MNGQVQPSVQSQLLPGKLVWWRPVSKSPGRDSLAHTTRATLNQKLHSRLLEDNPGRWHPAVQHDSNYNLVHTI